MRFAERITAVLIGGLAIYLGYRLFISVPQLKDSDGNFRLPWNISIVMTRVGPGVFFALFGTAAVCLALLRPLTIQPDTGSATYASARATPDADSRADGRALLRREIASLNSLPHQLRLDLPTQDRRDIERSIRRMKLLLMKPVWGQPSEGFGEFSVFESWVEKEERDPPPAGMAGALDLYRYGGTP
jgi:hypothetical protein